MIGEKIKILRLQRKLSLRKMGELLELSQTAVAKLENNQLTPNSTILIKLSNLFNVEYSFFFQNNCFSIEKERWINDTKINYKTKSYINSISEAVLNNYLEVENMFFKNKNSDIIKLINNLKEMDNHEEKIKLFKQILNINEFPNNNLINILEKFGFIVLVINCEADKFSGKSGIISERPFIILSKKLNGYSLIYSLVKALGLLFIKDENDVEQFALEFLISKKELINYIGEKRKSISSFEIKYLSENYFLSPYTIIKKIKDEKIISRYEYSNLLNIFKENEFKFEQQVTLPKKFESMICKAVSENMISESKGAEYLNIKTIDFYENYLN